MGVVLFSACELIYIFMERPGQARHRNKILNFEELVGEISNMDMKDLGPHSARSTK